MKRNQSYDTAEPIKYYFLISHGFPFLITGICMLLENSFYISNSLYGKLVYLGLLSPIFAALFVLYKFYSKKERKNYWFSTIDFKRISWKWYLIIIFLPILIRFLAALIDASITANSFQFTISPNMTLTYAIILLFFGPIPEEMGWRGIALPELQKKFGFNIAVLILGFMWAIWHFPLFLIEGTYQNQLGLFSPMFWNFMLGVLLTSVIYGVIYNRTNKSILAVILFHYFGNLTGETFVMTSKAELISTVLRGVLALFIIVYYAELKGVRQK
jgi:membrane protease YdiL (CAAX protease family)